MAISNISQAYPNFTPREAKKLAKENFLSIAQTVAEILLLANDRFDINAHIANKDEALNKLKALTKNNKNGVVFASMHFGNWELLAHFLAYNGYPSMGIGRKGNNKLIEKKLTLPFRQKHGNTNIYKDQAMIRLIKSLRENQSVGLLIDQKAGQQNSVKTTFFGRKCYTTSSLAILKIRYNPLVIPIFLKRLSSGSYEVVINTLNSSQDFLKNDEKSVLHLTQAYNDILEKTIKASPKQWFWMHNRWKLV